MFAVWVLVVVGAIGITGLTSLALYRGGMSAGLGRNTSGVLGGSTAVLLAGWFVVSGVIAGHGSYDTPGQLPPWLAIVLVGDLVVLLAATRIPVVARALAAPGMVARLQSAHSFRVVGLAFLIMMALGHLPALFALPAGLGDIATGIAAPFVARSTSRRAAVWFNALGITDLVVAVTLGSLTTFGVIAVTPSAQAIAQLPIALIPTATVPLLITLHITSLRGLAAARVRPEVRATALAS
jgi:hypothetical protein